MKAKLFFVFCLCALSMSVWADPDIITWKGNARRMVWSLYREFSSVDGLREYRTDQYLFGKDTTIGNNAYREVFWREDSDAKNEVSVNYALREDSVRVYVYDYASQKEYVFFDFSLKENDILAMDWIEETDARKNPVFRVLAVGDTTMATYWGQWRDETFHFLKVYDTVHQVTDMWMTEVGSISHGIVWHRDFGASLDTLETVLCVNGGETYKNPEYPSCYISQSEPEYVSCTERLIITWAPSLSFPELDCCYKALAIKWGELTPILSFNSIWAYDRLPLQVNGVDYTEGDSVEVEGYVSIKRDIRGWLYSELEIENIRKIDTTPAPGPWSIMERYEVSEVCTLVEDTTYKEEADYTITLEVGEETDHVIRFMIPAHGIPDFVLAEFNNGGAFSFSQKFRLGDGMDDEPYYLNIHGDGRVRKDSLTMKYVLAATGAYGTLQCAVKGIRQTVGTEGNKAVQQVSVYPNPIRDRFKINSDIELKEWQVYSLSGKLIQSGNGNDMEINCHDWASGVYVFRWESTNHETGFVKLIKE